MIKAHYRTTTGRLTFEVQGETVKDIFREVASVQEVFDSEGACGVCQGTALRFLARKVDAYDFYELACQNPECRSRFEFGQTKTGGALFPKRKDDDGKWLPNRGWSRYEKPGENGSGAAKPQSGPAPVSAPSAAAGKSGPQPVAGPAPKNNGVAVYPDWTAAENSPDWGKQWLQIGTKLFKLSPDGANYNEVRRDATPVR